MAPILRYDLSGNALFTRVSVLPLARVHALVEEYIFTGERPTSIEWQQIEWQQMPRLDPRW